jgi:hypothetical protein
LTANSAANAGFWSRSYAIYMPFLY